MDLNYYEIIKAKYPGAVCPFDGGIANFDVLDRGEDGIDIYLWLLSDPKPTVEELIEYANSPAYLAVWGAKLKAEADSQVNTWANQKVMDYHILEPELFYVAMISNIAFRLLEWTQLGKPAQVDPLRFMVTYAEAQAYSETTMPGMTAADLLRLQETRWLQMQQGFAGIVYVRRLVLGQIELAAVDEELPAALASLTVSLDPLLAETMQNLAAQAAQLLAKPSEV
jgi:hypothetical protein